MILTVEGTVRWESSPVRCLVTVQVKHVTGGDDAIAVGVRVAVVRDRGRVLSSGLLPAIWSCGTRTYGACERDGGSDQTRTSYREL